MYVAIKIAVFGVCSLLAAGVLGDSFGALANCVFCEFTGKEKTHSGLNFPGRNGRLLVLKCQAGCLSSNSLEDIVYERVHDAHCFGRDSDIGVNLFQNIVDVDSIAFLSLPLSLLFARSTNLSTFLSCSLLSFLGHFWRLFTTGFGSVRHFRFLQKLELNCACCSFKTYTKRNGLQNHKNIDSAI